MIRFNPVTVKYSKLLLILLFISAAMYSCSSRKQNKSFDYNDGIYYLQLDGTDEQMGYKYGLAFKDKIREQVKKYKQTIYNRFGEENGRAMINWALKEAGFTKDLKKYLPNVYTEIEAIASAAELPIEDILLLNMEEEITHAAPVALNIPTKQIITPIATVMQVQVEDEEKLSAQNIGFSNPLLHGNQLVIRYKYPDKEILVYTFIGRVGGVGVNNKGFSALAANLPQGRKRKSNGLNVNFMLRMLLEHDDVESALATLKTTPKFSSNSYALADYRQSVITEESGDKFVSSPMLQYPGFQCHTNHILWIEPEYRVEIPSVFENSEPLPGEKSLYTITRFEQAKAAFSGEIDEVEDDTLQELLVKPGLNSSNKHSKTLQSIIIEYDNDELDMIVSAGSDPERDWNRYDF